MTNRLNYYSQDDFEHDPSPLPRELSSSDLRSRSSLRFEAIIGNGMSCIGIYNGDRVIVDTKEQARDGDRYRKNNMPGYARDRKMPTEGA